MLAPFLSKAVEASRCHFFWKLVDETQMCKPPEATRHHNSIKYLILLPLRAVQFRPFHFDTPCMSRSKKHGGSTQQHEVRSCCIQQQQFLIFFLQPGVSKIFKTLKMKMFYLYALNHGIVIEEWIISMAKFYIEIYLLQKTLKLFEYI